MLIIRDRSISLIVLYACALHLTWAWLVLLDPAAMGATAVDALARYVRWGPGLSVMLASGAMLALFGMLSLRPLALVLLMPQQAFLMASAAGALQAIALSSYADGVVRPMAFIAADQVHAVLAAVGHTAAIIIHALRAIDAPR